MRSTWAFIMAALTACAREEKPSDLSDLSRMLEDRATLTALETELSARADAPSGWKADSAEVAALSRRTQDALAKAAAALGQPAYLQAPYRSQHLRVGFMPGPGVLFPDQIEGNCVVSEPWKKGLLLSLRPTDLEKAKQVGVAVVFLSQRAYEQSRALPTRARKALIDTLIKQGGAGLQEYLEEIAVTRRDLLALLSGFLEKAKALPQPERDALESARQAERKRLETLAGR